MSSFAVHASHFIAPRICSVIRFDYIAIYLFGFNMEGVEPAVSRFAVQGSFFVLFNSGPIHFKKSPQHFDTHQASGHSD